MAAALLLAASPVLAALQDTEVVDAKRLGFEYHCFFEVEGWKGRDRAEEDFVQRLKDQRVAHEKRGSGSDAVQEILAKALLSRARTLEPTQRDAAREKLAELRGLTAGTKAVVEAKVAAGDRLAALNMADARDLLGKRDSSDRTRSLLEGCLGASDPAIQEEAGEGLAKVAKWASNFDAEKAKGAGPEAAALSKVTSSLRDSFTRLQVPEDSPARKVFRTLDAELRKLEDAITFVALDRKEISASYTGPATPLDARARIQFVPTGGEAKPWPGDGKPGAIPSGEDIAVLRGTYDILVFADASGTGAPACVWRGVRMDQKALRIPLPTKAPKGMVFIGPWKDAQGADHGGFFIDRTEVTNADVRAVGDRPELAPVVNNLDGPPENPAWFGAIEKATAAGDEKAITAYPTIVGKQIPTIQQWLDAAYGPANPPWPWGTEGLKPGANVQLGSPAPVGGRLEGASPFGLLDTIGNMAEWVTVPGTPGIWSVGGHSELKPEQYAGMGGFKPARDPAPGFTAYSGLGANQSKYTNYQSTADYNGTGLRLVVPVNR